MFPRLIKFKILMQVGIVLGAGTFMAWFPFLANAQIFSSANFQVQHSVIQPANYATSASFSLFSTLSELAIGTSTSGSFGINAGFLYFPLVTSPVLSAVAGTQKVTLSWTSAQGFLGINIASYSVGLATVSGGPYAFTNVGNVTSSVRSGLTAGSTYYFILRAIDGVGDTVATSSEVSSVPTAPAPAPPAASEGGPAAAGGGAAGGGAPLLVTQVILKGVAYPGASINILKDGSKAAVIKANGNGDWALTLDVDGGIYTFSVYAVDGDGRRSVTFSFTTNVPTGMVATISDIIVSPTIGADKSQVKFGNNIKFFGFSYPSSTVNVIINSEETLMDKIDSDKFGRWNYVLNSAALEKGDHTTKSQTVTPKELASPFSESLAFRVSDSDISFERVVRKGPICNKNGDINNDNKVNIVDFSILLYFWKQRNPGNPCADINKDGIVNLADFSIMLYYWTG